MIHSGTLLKVGEVLIITALVQLVLIRAVLASWAMWSLHSEVI